MPCAARASTSCRCRSEGMGTAFPDRAGRTVWASAWGKRLRVRISNRSGFNLPRLTLGHQRVTTVIVHLSCLSRPHESRRSGCNEEVRMPAGEDAHHATKDRGRRRQSAVFEGSVPQGEACLKVISTICGRAKKRRGGNIVPTPFDITTVVVAVRTIPVRYF